MCDIRESVCMYAPLFIAINSEPQTPAQNIDYTFAREELMLNELSNDPIQRAIARLEKQHEEDKQVYLGIDDVWRRYSKILLISNREYRIFISKVIQVQQYFQEKRRTIWRFTKNYQFSILTSLIGSK